MDQPDTSIFIPRTLASAEKLLNDIGGLMTAKEWQRAALVFAFTKEGRPGPKSADVPSSGQIISMSEFARLGIIGLSSRETVARYRRAWEATGREAAPGRKVSLDGLPEWQSIFDASDSGGRPRAPMAEIVKRAERDPEYADRLVEGVTKVRPEVISSKRIATAVTKSPGMAEKVLRESPAAGKAFGQAAVTGWQREQREAGIEPDKRGDTHGYLIASGHITSARRKVLEAIKEVGAISLTADHRADLLEVLTLLENATSMLHSMVETGKSFDDEVADLLKQGGE